MNLSDFPIPVFRRLPPFSDCLTQPEEIGGKGGSRPMPPFCPDVRGCSRWGHSLFRRGRSSRWLGKIWFVGTIIRFVGAKLGAGRAEFELASSAIRYERRGGGRNTREEDKVRRCRYTFKLYFFSLKTGQVREGVDTDKSTTTAFFVLCATSGPLRARTYKPHWKSRTRRIPRLVAFRDPRIGVATEQW